MSCSRQKIVCNHYDSLILTSYQVEVLSGVVSESFEVHVQLREDVEGDERDDALSVGRDLVHRHAPVLHRDRLHVGLGGRALADVRSLETNSQEIFLLS